MPGDHAQAELRAHPETITAFGHTAGILAQQLRDAAARTREGNPTPLTTALGPVAADFLTAFTTAHREHERDLTRLGAVLAGMGEAAVAAAASYERAVDDTTARLQASGGR
ncbi:type VII secretion target [Rhodococcus chondri]|uniref:Type VII secretion target n=1 Tax=Rhodococcus chondri TaxID=3065941 RepID=A0ABU7JZF4_9NOCA|nr:type VII secretion target [Rhodococcus sp. CC-R104]MEE2035393.1 type VII secretion target [Rhodococcus sp. CC-R104]